MVMNSCPIAPFELGAWMGRQYIHLIGAERHAIFVELILLEIPVKPGEESYGRLRVSTIPHASHESGC